MKALPERVPRRPLFDGLPIRLSPLRIMTYRDGPPVVILPRFVGHPDGTTTEITTPDVQQPPEQV